MHPQAPDLARRRLLALASALLVTSGSTKSAESKHPPVRVFVDAALARYGFPHGHPLGIDRQAAFMREATAQGLLDKVERAPSRVASTDELARFHTADYIQEVATAEKRGRELLDGGDTPVFPGVFNAASTVAGAALEGLSQIMSGTCVRTFQAIGGLHHAARTHAAGFCVFNDLGVVIETLRHVHGVQRVAYVDIDAHHGDGVYYGFANDPGVIIADLHQDSRTLFPGTGREDETGEGAATGTKLNIEMPPRAGDAEFLRAWIRVEAHLEKFQPEFYILQAGADSLKGDPLAQLEYTAAAHAHATTRLRRLADRHAEGRLMAFGGGGYDRGNLGRAWSTVLRELIVDNS